MERTPGAIHSLRLMHAIDIVWAQALQGTQPAQRVSSVIRHILELSVEPKIELTLLTLLSVISYHV